MDNRLAGKVAIVTGGGRGIGAGIVTAFRAAGARVAILQRSPLESLPPDGSVLSVAVDLTNEAALQQAVQTVLSAWGGVDILVNNAGIMFERTVESMSVAEWDSMMDLNLKAPFLLIKHVLPAMRARGGGSIVNIGSIEGLGSNPGHAAYSASKAGLHGLTAAVAVDQGRDNVRCNAIAPGWIDSDLSEAYLQSMPDSARVRRDILAMHPVGRLGTAADVGALALWLASDESTFVTGQVYVIDGGRTKKLPLPVLT